MTKETFDTTEQKIIDVARKLFAEKGLKGTTIREVAEKAEVNVALVNYYFRSKKRLFMSIFKEKFNSFSESGTHLLTDISFPLEERIKKYVEYAVDFLMSDKNLPIFILSEIHYNSEFMEEFVCNTKSGNLSRLALFQEHLDKEFEAGNIRKTDAVEFELALASLIFFPFLSNAMLEKGGKLGEESFSTFINRWKTTVSQMIFNFLKK